jgi:hypothetical protein
MSKMKILPSIRSLIKIEQQFYLPIIKKPIRIQNGNFTNFLAALPKAAHCFELNLTYPS